MKIKRLGIWREILIDDYFPCKPMLDSIFSKSLENDFWV